MTDALYPAGPIALDHVQLAMPPGNESAAVAFYEGILGISQVPKPAALALRGGCWFERGELRLHLGVEDSFVPARKAHPALRVARFGDFVERLRARGIDVRDGETIAGVGRCYVDDPFGNRIELIDARP